MGDLPEFNASSGSEAIDDVIARDKQAEAAAVKRARVAAEKRAKIEESKLAKVEGSGMSASDFAGGGDAHGAGPLVTDFAKQLQADMMTREHNRRQRSMDTEAEANRVAADFENDQAVQRDKAREAADSAASFKSKVDAAGMSVAALAAAMDAVSSAQAAAAKSDASLKGRTSDAMRTLGFSTADIEAKHAAYAKGDALPSGLSPEDELKLYEAAASSKPAFVAYGSGVRSDINSVIGRSDIPISARMAALRMPFAPGVMLRGTSAGLSGQDQSGAVAKDFAAITGAMKSAGEAAGAGPGSDVAVYDAYIQQRIDSGGIAGTTAAFLQKGWIGDFGGQWLNRVAAKADFAMGEAQRFQDDLAKQAEERHAAAVGREVGRAMKTNSPPPSTNAGRHGP